MAQRQRGTAIDRVNWCNMGDGEVAVAWGWRSLRDALMASVGTFKARVEVCRSGFVEGSLQVSLSEVVRGQHHLGFDKAGLRSMWKKALGSSAKEVVEFGTERLVFEVVIPDVPEDLIFEPQVIDRTRAGPPEGVQPALPFAQGVWDFAVEGLFLGIGSALATRLATLLVGPPRTRVVLPHEHVIPGNGDNSDSVAPDLGPHAETLAIISSLIATGNTRETEITDDGVFLDVTGLIPADVKAKGPV